MATFVLVHDAWHGGWCWERLTPLLRATGHTVVTPTLTGLGERVHLLTHDVGLSTHIQDIVHVLKYESLHEVILVGHGYGGMVVTGVAHELPDRLRLLLYLDALFPLDNDRSVSELQRPHRGLSRLPRYEADMREWQRVEPTMPMMSGDMRPLELPGHEIGYPKPGRVPVLRPPHDLSRFGVTNERTLRWLRARLTPHPLRTMRERVPGDAASDARIARAYISYPAPGQPDRYRVFGERVREDGGAWHELIGGHDAMITVPDELGALLSSLAG